MGGSFGDHPNDRPARGINLNFINIQLWSFVPAAERTTLLKVVVDNAIVSCGQCGGEQRLAMAEFHWQLWEVQAMFRVVAGKENVVSGEQSLTLINIL